MKVGLIRRLQTEHLCPASKCLEVMRAREGAFTDAGEEVVCVAVNTCGGCPGKNAAQRARNMAAQGAEAIAISSCVTLGTPLGFPCPFHRKMIEIVKAAVGDSVKVLEYTHPAK